MFVHSGTRRTLLCRKSRYIGKYVLDDGSKERMESTTIADEIEISPGLIR